tara:strand:+ start:264 stop:443 length:180 start_codon:yes stop_codon:yes gene_type:complete
MYGFSRKLNTASLSELEDKCMELSGTNYGHNMIGIIIGIVSDRFGEDEADRLHELYQRD